MSHTTDTDLLATFNAVRGSLYSALYFLLGNSADAQDALQAAFLNCWQARHQANRVRNLRAWIWTIAVNNARDQLRSAWRRRRRGLGQLAAAAETAHASPADSAIRNEKQERLRRALADLPVAEREVFLLRQNSGLTFDEIAAVQQRPVGTVKTQMRAAIRKLRRCLTQSEGANPLPVSTAGDG